MTTGNNEELRGLIGELHECANGLLSTNLLRSRQVNNIAKKLEAALPKSSPEGLTFEQWWAEEWLDDIGFDNVHEEEIAKRVAQSAWDDALAAPSSPIEGLRELRAKVAAMNENHCKRFNGDMHVPGECTICDVIRADAALAPQVGPVSAEEE